MKCGVRVALGVAGGYFLGRTKKMKLAMMLGSMAAGRAAGGPGQLLRQGAKLVGQSPELGRLSDEIRGRLLDTAKVAAVAVATRQVEALTERVVSLAGTTVGDAGKTVSGAGDTVGKAVSSAGDTVGQTVSGVGETVGVVGRTIGGGGRRRSRDKADHEEPRDNDEQEYDEEPSEVPEDLDESADDSEPAQAQADEEIEEEESATPPRRAARAATGRRGRMTSAAPRTGKGTA